MTERVALVTGGSRGIGKAIVLALARAGWRVAFSFQSNQEAALQTEQEASQTSPALAIQADQGVAEQRERLLATVLERFGRLDLLVNNAGMAPRVRGDLLDVSLESYTEVMRANLEGPFFLSQSVARQMLSQPAPPTPWVGMLINIGSISAYTSSTNRGEYCLSKAGMGMLTALFADRLAAEKILVYEIRPGIIQTDMTAAATAKYDRLISEGLLPLPAWGKPEDVARAVCMLTEGSLAYSTGEVINVDGGFHLRRL